MHVFFQKWIYCLMVLAIIIQQSIHMYEVYENWNKGDVYTERSSDVIYLEKGLSDDNMEQGDVITCFSVECETKYTKKQFPYADELENKCDTAKFYKKKN